MNSIFLFPYKAVTFEFIAFVKSHKADKNKIKQRVTFTEKEQMSLSQCLKKYPCYIFV